MDIATKLATSSTASRMSIERYLQAPLEDEPASVPAINAALMQQGVPSHEQQRRGHHRRGHSGATSYDTFSEERRTLYTAASGPVSTGTSFSIGARVNPRHTNEVHPEIIELPSLRMVGLEHDTVPSQEVSNTGRTGNFERTLTELRNTSPLAVQVDSAYRAKIEAELASLQHRARTLDEQMRSFREQRANDELLVPRITDSVAYEQIISRPKLAWLLGDVDMNNTSSLRPTEPAKNVARPATSDRMKEDMQQRLPRRSKSSSALGNDVQQSFMNPKTLTIDRTHSRRQKFFCTFCQKKFHNRVSQTTIPT